MPFYAPGLTGANDYLDIRTGFRKQWVDFEGAPLSYFIGGSGALKIAQHNPHKHNSVRVGNESLYKRKTTKFAFGGYVFDEKIGAFKQFGSLISAAAHVTITNNTYLSLGITTGYHNTRLDMNNLRVLNPDNDELYQDYYNNGARSNYLKLNAGIALYSDKYYLSYAIINLMNEQLGGNESLFNDTVDKLYTIVGGYRISPGPKFELIPNAYIRLSSNSPFLMDIGARIRYEQFIYIGMSYRNDQTAIGMFGIQLNNKYSFGYSFERKSIDFAGTSPLSHEVVIGIQLFNSNNYTSLW